MQKDSQQVFAHPGWADSRLGGVTAAWYRRSITVPSAWAGRRVGLSLEYLNSFAVVMVDGKKAGELRFPGGELDLTDVCAPGAKQVLDLLVVALPLKGVLQSYTDSNAAREVKGRVARRGLCGDVYLNGTPGGPRLGEVKVDTSVRQQAITIAASTEGLMREARYGLRARILSAGQVVQTFTRQGLELTGSEAGGLAFTEKWRPARLWDLHTPQNQYDLELSLLDAAGELLDTTWTMRFGCREFWIDGRDFFLNGSRIQLCAVPFDNAQIGAAQACYTGARESLARLKAMGINFVYTHNYGCEPGAHLSFAELLRAADDVGMLVSLSQPHFSHYEWAGSEADRTNGYARHAAFYTTVAGNHASVVAYAMSHNATGYNDDMNPDLIDGLTEPRDTWGLKNAALALRAEAIVKRLDPGRIVYHHASGNLGSMHPINFYPNFTPVQELSDWFEHWATQGVKPVFTCEYGAPFTWDWTMYRGWYKGQREFGSATVPWEFCLAEWNAQFVGDRAFKISEPEQANLRWEARQFRAGKVWHRWDYPNEVGSSRFEERYPVFALYLADNWPAFRAWGVSAISPWEYGHFWKLRDGVDRRRKELPVDWEHLQRPGLSPDYLADQYERMDLAFERSDWVATAAAQALLRANGPLLAFIGGKPERFTSKDHNFLPGETVEKQIIIINNSRETVTGECQWSFGLPRAETGSGRFTLPTGEQKRVPMRFALPNTLAAGAYELSAAVRFGNGESQTDTFTVHVMPAPATLQPGLKAALFDPKGKTARALARLGVQYQLVDAAVDLSNYDLLILGKGALTVGGPAPAIGRVREGLKVLMFEQMPDVLEQRFGFRVAEYGLRQVFRRVPDHPVLAGFSPENDRDWRGEATLLPPRGTYQMRPRHGPTVTWCGLPVTRIWRCGNRGNVASVLIEKPTRGDFLPILDGGYSLQFSPLMEYREGKGLILFCQVDVTGRTEPEPAAEMLTRNLLRYLADWKPARARRAVYVGDPAGRRHLETAGIAPAAYAGGVLGADQVLVVGPGGGRDLAAHRDSLAASLRAGTRLLGIGLDQADAANLPLDQLSFKTAEHIAAFFAAPGNNSALRGVGPADVHNRDPRELPLVSAGALARGDGVLAETPDQTSVFCQLVPWQFQPISQMNLKRTFRRASFVVTRLLGNLGVSGETPVLARFSSPVDPAAVGQRWLEGLYLDQPEEWDDPYRFFRW
jgi:hypothetical protein